MGKARERVLSVWRDQIKPKVLVKGSGAPLLYLHGAYGLKWDLPFVEELARTHEVYAPEHPGTTEGDPDGIRPLDNIWDLVLYYYEVLDKLGLERPAVVGHSFGAMVACEIAATNPKSVGKLVAISALGLWRDDTPIPNYMVTPPAELAQLVFADPKSAAAAKLLAVPEDPEAQMKDQIERMWALGCTGKFVWPLPDKGLAKRLHRISAPTLILWGKRDGLVPLVYADEFASRISGSRVTIVDGTSHMLHLEQPKQVAKTVSDFLSP
jgi:pimeloyl-ACP methyl ester carboxylesterase